MRDLRIRVQAAFKTRVEAQVQHFVAGAADVAACDDISAIASEQAIIMTPNGRRPENHS
jgi:hypothetical protein